jgi:hypothetical protein
MAHCNTILQQMLKLIPRHHFSRLEREHGTGRPARSFSRWHQWVYIYPHADYFLCQPAGWGGCFESPVYEPLSSGSQAGDPLAFLRPCSPSCISVAWPIPPGTNSSSKISFTILPAL